MEISSWLTCFLALSYFYSKVNFQLLEIVQKGFKKLAINNFKVLPKKRTQLETLKKNLGKFSDKNLIYLKILTSFTSIGLTDVKVSRNS
jgi:hypothetical protein